MASESALDGCPEACDELSEEIQQSLRAVEARWGELEARLEHAEESVLEKHADSLREWFTLDEAAFTDWSDGSLRCKIRDRIQKLTLVPLLDRMRRRVCLPESIEVALARSDDRSLIDVLIEHWELMAKPAVAEARDADDKLGRWIQKMTRLGMSQDVGKAEQTRPAIWSIARKALDEVAAAAAQLDAALAAEADAEVEAGLVAAVPAMVARAACDWHFSRCCAEFDQLEGWWQGARAALQRRPAVWERLLKKDEVFVRRIDVGIEELRAERCNYAQHATFGASAAVSAGRGAPVLNTRRSSTEWPQEAGSMLARAVGEMRRRLRPIRDAAAWRVIDRAKAINAELRAASGVGKQGQERSPWSSTDVDTGIAALCEELGVNRPPNDAQRKQATCVPATSSDLAEVALGFMQRIDRLAALLGDLGELPQAEGVPDAGGIGYILEEAQQGVAYLSEELLVVLDDPTSDTVWAWVKRWMQWGKEVGGQRLNAAMCALPLRQRAADPAQRRRLALMRGVQILLDDSGLRAWLLTPTAAPAESSEACEKQGASTSADLVVKPIEDMEALTLPIDPPPSAARLSPRSGYRPRSRKGPAQTEAAAKVGKHSEDNDHAGQGLGADAAQPSTPAPLVMSPVAARQLEPTLPQQEARRSSSVAPPSPQNFDSLAQEPSPCVEQLPAPTLPLRASFPLGPEPSEPYGGMSPMGASCSAELPLTRPETPSTPWTRPGTPSWLLPPWPRPDAGLGASARPDTPSTVCDDAEAVSVPRWKLVEGECIPLRPGSSCSNRLPPLKPPKRAW